MRTLWSSSLRLCHNLRGREKETVTFYSLREILGRNEIRFLSSPNTFFNSISIEQNKSRNEHVYVSSSATQETLPDEQTQIRDASKTVHVKFQLQRKCSFGEQFLLLGDETLFGSWDPLSAIPLDWSDGDIWTVELDVPTEKLIQYKFIMKDITGNIFWQPGPDRELKTWETTKTISVSEDWENAELQIILEEELVPKNNEELIVVSDMKIVADNINGAEKSMPNVIGEKNIFCANEEQKPDHVSNDEVSYEDIPVLVPGLTPIAAIDTEEISSLESNNYIADNPSSQAEKLKEHSGSELEIESPHSEDSTEMMIYIQEKEQDNKQEIKYYSTDDKGQAYSKQIETVLENDVQWGRKTLQKLLKSFGF